MKTFRMRLSTVVIWTTILTICLALNSPMADMVFGACPDENASSGPCLTIPIATCANAQPCAPPHVGVTNKSGMFQCISKDNANQQCVDNQANPPQMAPCSTSCDCTMDAMGNCVTNPNQCFDTEKAIKATIGC